MGLFHSPSTDFSAGIQECALLTLALARILIAPDFCPDTAEILKEGTFHSTGKFHQPVCTVDSEAVGTLEEIARVT